MLKTHIPGCLRLATLIALVFPTLVSGQTETDGELQLPELETQVIRRADEVRVRSGQMPHFAVVHEVDVSLWSHGRWHSENAGRVRWELTVGSAKALSLSLAFGKLSLPVGARLFVTSVASGEVLGPLWPDARGSLWTPPIAGSELRIELEVSASEIDRTELELTRVHHGYAGFGSRQPKSGLCEIDLACDVPPAWQELGQSVGLMVVDGVRFCSGFLVNNTRLDGRPYFLTALHCGLDLESAASVVVIWNHENPTCQPGSDADRQPAFQSGATLRATHRPTDIVLLELDEKPPVEWQVHYSGWNRSTTNPERSVVIHHPNSDFKKIAFDHQEALTTRYLQAFETAGSDYLRVESWDTGTTEGGSSGAPLFDEFGQAIGVLRGGFASCGQRDADWFGRLSSAWTGATRDRGLGTWLDPTDSGILSLQSLGSDTEHRDVFERAR